MIQANQQEFNYADNYIRHGELHSDASANSDGIGSSLSSSPAPSLTDSNSSSSNSSSPAKFAYSTPYVHNTQLSHFAKPNEHYQQMPPAYFNRQYPTQKFPFDQQMLQYQQYASNYYSNSFNDSCYQSRNSSFNYSTESVEAKQSKPKPVINSLHKFSIEAILAKPSNMKPQNSSTQQQAIKQPVQLQQPTESVKTEKGKRRKRTSTNELETSSNNKRIRTIFTQDQLDKLEVEFLKQQYMVGSERTYLAQSLNLTESQVKIWFQNRRIKWRKTAAEENQQNASKSNKQANLDDEEDSHSNLNDSIESYDDE